MIEGWPLERGGYRENNCPCLYFLAGYEGWPWGMGAVYRGTTVLQKYIHPQIVCGTPKRTLVL